MMKYSCPRQSIWQLAATSFRKVCKIGLPIARENRIILCIDFLKAQILKLLLFKLTIITTFGATWHQRLVGFFFQRVNPLHH